MRRTGRGSRARWRGSSSTGGDHAVGEERRLAYVAATRARHALLLSASVWTTASTPRLTSRFLLEVREAVAAGRLPAAERCWADLPEAGPDVVRPGGEEAAGAGWPVDAMAHRRPALAEAATRVRAAVADGGRPDVERDAPIASDGPPPPSRHQEIELLLAERDAGRARTGEPVQLGSHLSTSALVALARDRDAFTLDLRRPLPTAPARAARRGTAFHAWVEQHYAMAAMVDVSELPGSADDDPEGEEALETMKERFLASEWADRVPVEVETSVETVLDGVAVRGRIDAVFPREDGGFTVIDWKTGLPPDGGGGAHSGPAARGIPGGLRPAARRRPGSRGRGVLLRPHRGDGPAQPAGDGGDHRGAAADPVTGPSQDQRGTARPSGMPSALSGWAAIRSVPHST